MRARDTLSGRFVKVDMPELPEPAAAVALTAAASVLPSATIERMPRNPAGWQEQAWRLWRILGVLHAPTSAKARQVGRLKWNVEVDGRLLEPEAAAAAVAAVTSPMSVKEASRRIALNLEVAGEVFLARASDEWAVYASTKSKLKELLKAADIVVQGIQADPEEPDKPDSGIRAALGTADAIRLMAAMSRNQDRNRLAQRGILFMPKEAQFPEGDDFQANLEEAMTAPIADQYSPSAVVPLKVDYPGDLIEKVKHLVLESPYDDKLMARIEAAIKQLALELDMSPEVLLGNMDSNHWNAWLSSEENYRAHVEPLGDATGEVYAKAMMAATDGKSVIVVTPDPSELLARRSSVADAFEGLRLGAVGFDYVRRQMGADDDDAPTLEEIALILTLTGNASQSIPVNAPPLLPKVAPSPNGNGAVTAAVKDSDKALDTLAKRLVDVDFRLLSVLEGLASMAVQSAREAAKADENAAEQAISPHMERLGDAWVREVQGARKVLTSLGIDATGPEWNTAEEASADLLVDEMSGFVISTLERTGSQMPAVPVLVLRRVLATAGGSGTAVVAAITSNPSPTFADPQGFAIGVLPLKELKGQGVELVNWRFRYGPLSRSHPFVEHKAVDGQYMTADGYTSEGWYPGDHRGCVRAGTFVEGPVASAATLREYEGVMLDLTLASGKLVSITPNHPVLTPKGWVAAGLLQEGGYVVGRFDSHRAASLVPHDYDAPALIEDVVGALHEAPGVFTASVPVTAEHFHGDGKGSEVAVVSADRLLSDGVNMTLGEPTSQQLLGGVESTRGLTRLGDADPLGFWLALPPLSGMGRRGPELALLGGGPQVLGELGGAVAARLNTSTEQAVADDGTRDAETVTEREFRLSGLVAADQIVHIKRYSFGGHVFNLQTSPGWYVAEGVIVHNCDCGVDPVFRRVKEPEEV